MLDSMFTEFRTCTCFYEQSRRSDDDQNCVTVFMTKLDLSQNSFTEKCRPRSYFLLNCNSASKIRITITTRDVCQYLLAAYHTHDNEKARRKSKKKRKKKQRKEKGEEG